jgi:hypothetical protein
VAEGPQEWWLRGLGAVCRGHEGESPLAAACVHHGGYGTRSSTLLRIDADPLRSELLFADGPPCTAEYRDMTRLLHELPRTGDAAAREAQVGSIR